MRNRSRPIESILRHVKSLELFFDYTCPFAYLGVSQAPALAARLGVEIAYRPILLGGVFRARGTPQKLFDTLGPAKAANNTNDMQRWAARYGLPLRMPPNHPMRSVDALRATLATGLDLKVIAGFFRAYWDENRDIADPAVIADILATAGHVMPANLDAQKDDLRKRTDEAVDRGVFGVPTYIVDGSDLYWGQDRTALLEGLPVRIPEKGPREIEIFWDFASPFAYLASARIEAMAEKTNTNLIWTPIFVGGLFKALGGAVVPLETFSDAKRRHMLEDLSRWAARLDVPFRFPTTFPINSAAASRCYLSLPPTQQSAFRNALFRAYWGEDTDISGDAYLLAHAGADALAKSKTNTAKAELRANTERAASRGVFGVPTFLAEDQDLFFGQDRLDMVFGL